PVRELRGPATDGVARRGAARDRVPAEYRSGLQARRLRALAERSGHRHIPTQPIELPVPAPASPAPEQAEPSRPAADADEARPPAPPLAPAARVTPPVAPAAHLPASLAPSAPL